ncbi:MAG: N-acetyltransferase family protein [Candidatus Nanohaloarchaea archaeon]
MNIRHATEYDVDGIRRVAAESWRETYFGILSKRAIKEVVSDWYDREGLRDDVEDPLFYVAEDEDEIVGFAHATIDGNEAELHRIYLDPDYQRRGIGSQLYRKIEEGLERNEVDTVILKVLAENDAGIKFYESRGFTGIDMEEVTFAGEMVDQKVMRKEL